MNGIERASRREALQLGIGAVITIITVLSTSRSVSADGQKLAKSAVQYTDAGTARNMDCDDCVQFISGRTPQEMGSCKIVQGEINPHGHCIAFSPAKV
jgi:hypothetical protein